MVLELTGVVAAKRAARMAEEDWPDDDAIRSAKLTESELVQPVPERVWAMRNAAGAPVAAPFRGSRLPSRVRALTCGAFLPPPTSAPPPQRRSA